MRLMRFQADENGIATLPLFRLIPAATVLVHPIVPDTGYTGSIRKPTIRWSAPPEEPAQWVNELSGCRGGISLEPNVEQRVLIPIGVTLRLRIHMAPALGFVNLSLGRVRLDQGQVADLGRVEFGPGIGVVVSVIDGMGRPLANAVVSCMDEEMWMYFNSATADEQGVALVGTPLHTTGRIRAYVDDPTTGERVSDSIPYQIGGVEDTGKEFVIRLAGATAAP